MKLYEVDPGTPFESSEGKPVATIGLSPKKLAHRYGLHFQEMVDDFDAFTIASVLLNGSVLARLMRYAHDPEQGTTVYVDSGASIEDAQWLLRRGLELSENDFTWLAQLEAQPHPVSV